MRQCQPKKKFESCWTVSLGEAPVILEKLESGWLHWVISPCIQLTSWFQCKIQLWWSISSSSFGVSTKSTSNLKSGTFQCPTGTVGEHVPRLADLFEWKQGHHRWVYNKWEVILSIQSRRVKTSEQHQNLSRFTKAGKKHWAEDQPEPIETCRSLNCTDELTGKS